MGSLEKSGDKNGRTRQEVESELVNPVKERVDAACCQFANQQLALQAGQGHFSENPITIQSLEGNPGFLLSSLSSAPAPHPPFRGCLMSKGPAANPRVSSPWAPHQAFLPHHLSLCLPGVWEQGVSAGKDRPTPALGFSQGWHLGLAWTAPWS